MIEEWKELPGEVKFAIIWLAALGIVGGTVLLILWPLITIISLVVIAVILGTAIAFAILDDHFGY